MLNDPQKRVHIDQLLAHFRRGFEPFVIVVFKSTHADAWFEIMRTTPEVRISADSRTIQLDATALIRIILAHWDTTFVRVLDKRNRALLYEIRQIRNRWAHQAPLTDDDVDRLADAVLRLLISIHADNVHEVQRVRDELRTQRYAHPSHRPIKRHRTMLIGSLLAVGVAVLGMLWWYDVLPPVAHPDGSSTPVAGATTTPVAQKALLGSAITATVDQSAAFPCSAGQIKGNPNTMIYHRPDGAYYAMTRNSTIVCFDSTAAAEHAGFRASKR